MDAALAILAAVVGFSAWRIYNQIKKTKATCELMASAFPLHTRSWRKRNEAGKEEYHFRFLVRDGGTIYECKLNIGPSGSVDGKTSKVEADAA